MAGHSKWANTKRKKSVKDAQKNKDRTRMLREIMVSVQEGGVDNNPRLQLAVQNAKKANVPKGKIEEAIKRASGANVQNYEEVLYEGYAPYGVALVIETMTDNTRRTVSLVRSILTKYGGKLASQHAVDHLFDRKGVFVMDALGVQDLEALTLSLLEAGIDALEEEDGELYITCPLQDFNQVREALSQAGLTPEEMSLQYIPATHVTLSSEAGERVERLIEALEKEEEIQRVYDNMCVAQEK